MLPHTRSDINMDVIIAKAIQLRQQEKFQELRELLAPVLSDEVYSAKAHLQIAWSYDNEGKERDAIKHYLSSLAGPLSATERLDASFGLASSYRSIGNYELALKYFELMISEYPEAIAVKPFYAMCLYNLGRHKEAVLLLLDLLILTTNSDEIKAYQRAIQLYAKELDRTW